jgi:excisionase family DNA binding protein
MTDEKLEQALQKVKERFAATTVPMPLPSRTPVRVAEKIALSASEAGALTGLSASTITRLVRRGVLAPVPHVGRVLIARRELDRWVESG